MRPIVHIELTGKGILTVMGIMALVTAILGLVWLCVGPVPALVGGLIVIVFIRGVIALFRTD